MERSNFATRQLAHLDKDMDNDKTILGKLETIKHIHRVRELLYLMIAELDRRAREHDQSKLESPEAEIFGEFTPELIKTEYDSPEYNKLLEKVKPAVEHHYSKNSHHPDFYKNGVNDMDLISILEMLVDWKASTERNKNGNIRKSIDINAQRFGIEPQLKRILENTVAKYF